MVYPKVRVEADEELVVVSDPSTGAIRLSRALLEPPPRDKDPRFMTRYERASNPPIDPPSLLSSLPALLGHIEERLENGLLEAWLSPHTYGPMPWFNPDAPDEFNARYLALEKLWSDPEEQWARAFCEHVVLTSYGGTGAIYHSGSGSIAETNRMAYGAVVDGGVMPIVFACEK